MTDRLRDSSADHAPPPSSSRVQGATAGSHPLGRWTWKSSSATWRLRRRYAKSQSSAVSSRRPCTAVPTRGVALSDVLAPSQLSERPNDDATPYDTKYEAREILVCAHTDLPASPRACVDAGTTTALDPPDYGLLTTQKTLRARLVVEIDGDSTSSSDRQELQVNAASMRAHVIRSSKPEPAMARLCASVRKGSPSWTRS